MKVLKTSGIYAILVIVLAAVFGLLATYKPGHAQSSGQGLRVSPVLNPVTAEPGASKEFPVTVENLTDSTVTLRVIINDLEAGDESGVPNIILDENQFAASRSLKRLVRPIENVTLAGRETKVVNAVIDVPADAAGGGYYGAVRFIPAESSSGEGNLQLTGSVASLTLLTVPGDINEELVVESFDVRKDDRKGVIFQNGPLEGVLRLKNNGNVHVAPTGTVKLKTKSGTVLESIEINNTNPRGNVLPDQTRRFNLPLSKVGKFGQYKLEAGIAYGTDGETLRASTSFYVIPWLLIALVLGVLILIVGGTIATRKYIRRQINKGRS